MKELKFDSVRIQQIRALLLHLTLNKVYRNPGCQFIFSGDSDILRSCMLLPDQSTPQSSLLIAQLSPECLERQSPFTGLHLMAAAIKAQLLFSDVWPQAWLLREAQPLKDVSVLKRLQG